MANETEDQIIEEGTEQGSGTGVNDATAGMPDTQTFTQEQLDSIITNRLNAESEKFARERANWQNEVSQREAYINGLQQSQAQNQQKVDPYADLSPDEKLVARATEAATRRFEERINARLNNFENTLAPITQRSQADEFFASKPSNLPPSIKNRAIQLLSQVRGVNLEGAYRLALAEDAEAKYQTGGSFNTQTNQVNQPKPRTGNRPIPHTEMGGANRNLTNKPAQDEDDNLSWAQFREAAERDGAQVPDEGAMFGPRGAGKYFKP